MRFFLLLCSIIGVAHSVVEFTNSALYDLYDFKGVDEVHITKCDYGCLIFAATNGEAFVQYPEKLDPYAMNLIITNNDDGKTQSIAKLAQQQDANGKKIPLTITTHGNISVVNQNDPAEKLPGWTIILYVVEKTKAEEFSYEVYDVNNNKGKKITPKSDIVTFLSTYNFQIQSEKSNQANSVTARMVGFDNALEGNKDGCPYAYKTPDGPSFPGFTLMATSQIISFAIGKRNSAISMVPSLQFNSVRDFVPDGFFSSPGWNGCKKPNNGGFQSFRTRDDLPTDMYILTNVDDYFTMSMDVLPNFDGKHKLVISERGKVDAVVTGGTVLQHVDVANTNYLIFDFQNMRGDQGFIVRYSSKMITSTTTVGPSTEPINTVESTSPTQSPPTTSSGCRATGFLISLLILSLLL